MFHSTNFCYVVTGVYKICRITVYPKINVFFYNFQQKWRRQVLEKNSEIEHYREELDSLLSAMQVLKQGV